MKSRLLSVICFFFVVLSLFVSCEEPNAEAPKEVSYSTPTIKGTMMIPAGKNISPADIYVKVIDEEGKTVTIQKGNSDGTFVIQNLVENKKYSILFSSVAPEYTNRAISRETETSGGVGGWVHDVVPAIQEGNNVGSVKLKPLGTIKGKALVEGQSEHYDITVYIPGTSYIARTDKDGSFSIYNVPEGTYKLRYTLDDHLPVMLENVMLVCPEDSENPEVSVKNVTLKSSFGTVEGRAVLGDNDDSTGIGINLESEDGSITYPAFTSKDGYFTISSVLPGKYRVVASCEGYSSQVSSYFNVASGTLTKIGTLLELYSRSGVIEGSVSLKGSDVKSGIAVTFRNKDGSNSSTTMTGDDGGFTKRLKPGTYTVEFSYPDYTSRSIDATVVENNTTKISSMELSSVYGTIEGRSASPEETVTLIDEAGKPVQTIVSSADGTYRFSGIKSGTYSVRFSKTDFASYTVTNVEVNQSVKTIVNGRVLISIYGTIKGTSNSAGETVYLIRNGVQIDSSVTLESREYLFSGIEPGDYSVRFTKSGCKSYESDSITVLAGESYVIDGQKLTSIYGAVAGFVFLSGSEDFSGVTITLTSNESMTSSLVETTAADGSFRFSNITESGIYLLTYSKDGYVTDNTKSVEVTVGSVSNAGSVTLKSTVSTVKGKVQLEDAATYENVTILLRNDNNQYNATTDQNGEYIINRVLPGTYSFYASKDGYVTSTPVEVVVEPSTEKSIQTKTLSVAIRSVTGSVRLELLSDHSGALITATNLNDNTLVHSAITNSNGDFTLAGMKPGEYSVVISSNGYRTVTLPTINIVSSSTTDLPVTEMLINRGTVSGTAILEGRSSSEGITVELMKGSEVYASTTTDKSGNYSFYVPQGNYSGVRYSKTDFASSSVSKNIALFADNYVSMGDTELKATHNTITGKVDVLTTEDEANVTISFDGVESIPVFTTTSTGEFTFEHVPVGSYVMRFKRTDCSDITVPVNVVAADIIDLGTVTVTPNTATIKGTVVLKEGLSLEGVTVSVDMGGKILQTTTDASGRYEIGGVSIADEYTVIYSKNGWDTETQTISPKLDLLEIREMPEITLVDTTAPVLKSVTINNGANTAADRNVTLHIDAEDGGSDLKTMFIYDYSNPQYFGDYLSLADWTFESSNGLKTVYVKVVDRAGNESETISAKVTLTDQKKEVKGVLKGDDLTWTKDQSPYLVTGNLLVEKDDTLTIKSGVDVQFSGDYYLQVEGKISAVGTEEERIKIYGIDKGTDNWYGMKFINDNDSLLSYVDITGLRNGIVGYCDIDHALITSNSWAIGVGYQGYLKYSTITGSVSLQYNEVIGNNINGSTVSIDSAQIVSDNTIRGDIGISNSYIYRNTFSGIELITTNSFSYNNIVSSSIVYSYSDIQKFVTYNYCDLYLGYYSSSDSDNSPSDLYNIQFNNCTFPKFAADVKDSNFVNCGSIAVSSGRTEREKYICKGNYWGDVNTVEIKSKGEGQNLSFISDYYDDFNKSCIDYSGYKESAIVNAGYHETEPDGPYSGYNIGDKGPAGGLVFYDKGYYSDGWRYLEAASEDIGSYPFGYYRPDGNERVGTTSEIGSGRYNTEHLVEKMNIDGRAYSESYGTSVAEYAAKKCLDYSYGGYDDWFLPSSKELHQMYINLYKQGHSTFVGISYWSSSEGRYGDSALCQDFYYSGSIGGSGRSEIKCVRPVRAF